MKSYLFISCTGVHLVEWHIWFTIQLMDNSENCWLTFLTLCETESACSSSSNTCLLWRKLERLKDFVVVSLVSRVPVVMKWTILLFKIMREASVVAKLTSCAVTFINTLKAFNLNYAVRMLPSALSTVAVSSFSSSEFGVPS